jgi:NTE family protein
LVILRKISRKLGFEHIIRYNDGITSDFVLASCSVPINYDYTWLNVETRALVDDGGRDDNADTGDDHVPSYSIGNTGLRSFWDGGLLANTPLRQTIIAYRDYWYDVKKLKENVPKLSTI